MAALRQELACTGYVVFTPLEEEEAEIEYDTLPERQQAIIKRRLIDAHLEKIKNSDAVLIANFTKKAIEGYIGANTLMEMAFAYAFQKPVFVLHTLGEQNCKVEALGVQTANLRGKLSNLDLFLADTT